MATKKVAKPHSSEVRVGAVSVSDLRAHVLELEALTAGLRARIEEMSQAKIASVTIDGVTKLKRGAQLIAEFDAKLGPAIFKAKFK